MRGEPTNDDRAAWAENALNTFAEETYGGRTFSEEVACNPDGDATTMIPDLICDLLHLARRHGWDADDLIQQAKSNFDAEVDEENL